MPDTLDIRVDDGAVPAIVVAGDLDMAGAPALVEAVAELCRNAPAIMIDIGGLRFLDSAGLRSLLEASSICEQHGCELSLTPAGSRVRRVLELAGVLDALPFRGAAAADGDGPGPPADRAPEALPFRDAGAADGDGTGLPEDRAPEALPFRDTAATDGDGTGPPEDRAPDVLPFRGAAAADGDGAGPPADRAADLRHSR